VPVGRSIQLARLFGIRIGASPSWFAVLFIIIWLLSGQFQRTLDDHPETVAYLTAVAAAALFFVSLIAHELGHALVARREGIGISGIDLWFFGGLAKMTRDTRSPGEELRVAGAGPLVTLLVALLAFGGVALLGQTEGLTVVAAQDSSPLEALLRWLGFINVVLLLFNLVPAFPLDGGRLLRAAAWKITGDRGKGTRFSGRMGQAFGMALIALGVFWLLNDRGFDGLWMAVLGWFLLQAAGGAVASSRLTDRIGAVRIAEVMDGDPVTVPAATPAGEAHETYFLRYRWPWFCVVDAEGRYVGLLAAEQAEAAAPSTPVGELALAEQPVPADAPIEDLLGSEALRRLGSLPVVDRDGTLAGVVTVEGVQRALTSAVAT
jgi:Zn-dependent protease